MSLVSLRRVFGPSVRVRGAMRAAWATVALICLAVLGLARYLPPDPRGYGTHERLGMPPCSFVLTTGLPCPTCGMTSAFSYIMHGQPLRAFVAQPAGAVFCLGTMILLVYSAITAATGWMRTIQFERLGPVRIALGLGFLILGGWAFKLAYWVLSGTMTIR